MEQELELPSDVIAAIEANRQIDAIKLLREQSGLDLAEAKRLVDLYAARNPKLLSGAEMKDEGGGSKLVIAIAIVIGAYLAWRYLG